MKEVIGLNEKGIAKQVKDVKKLANRKSFVAFELPLVCMSLMMILIIVSLSSSANILPIVCSLNSVIVSTLSIRVSMERLIKTNLGLLGNELKSASGESVDLSSVNELEIVPRNIKIGEDLSHNNMVAIFKKGEYVICKSSFMNPIFIKSYEEDGVVREFLMEPTEEDIAELKRDLPEYSEEIERLELKLHL